jgi:hypothetical protein
MKKIIAITVASAMGIAAQATLVDDFSGDLSAYTETIVLAQNYDPAFTFSIVSGTLEVTRPTLGSGGTPQQDVFLRSDYSLTPGYVLRVDAVGLVTNTLYSDFGIVVGSQVNPNPAVYAGSNVDTRSNLVNVYFKGSYGTLGTRGADGVTQMYSNSGLYPTNAAGTVLGYYAVTGLWISEPSTGVYDVGYTLASGDILFHRYTVSGTQPGDTAIGTAIGFYADLRAGSDTYGFLDNLRLEPIPEPTTMAFCGLGGLLGLVAWMRRRMG